MPTGPKPKPPIERFRRFYSKASSTGCWQWHGNTNGAYGLFRIGSQTDGTRKIVLAHRWIYEHTNGRIKNGLFVCHTCDNKRCVNPAHMFLGTNSDNIRDAVAKGFTVGGPNRGESNGRAKLTAADVLKIRAEYGSRTLTSLGHEYGISATQVSWIIKRKSWAHVP